MALLSPSSVLNTVGPGSSGFAEYRHVGTSPVEIWYTNHAVTGGNLSTVAWPIGSVIYSPFLSPRGGTIDRLGFDCTTVGSAGSVARVAIYKAVSKTNIMPGALVVDGGEQITDVGTGVKSATISVKLAPDAMYWFAYLCGVAAPTLRGFGASGMMGLGLANTLNSVRCALKATTFAYAAFPATAPTVDGFDNGVGPLIGVRYSA